MADTQQVASGEAQNPVFRVGGVSFLRIPTAEPQRTADFYGNVFGWKIRDDPDEPAFEDGTGHVIGHFVRDDAVAGEAGVRPYVYVVDVDETLEKAREAGGEVVTAPYPEGDLWVATVRDPAGNVIGVWQSGPRA